MAMCFVPDCKHYTEQRRCRFYRFPRGGPPRRLWIKLIRRETPSKSSYVCSCHFVDGNKKNYPTLFDRGPRKRLRSLSPPEIAERKDKQVSVVNKPSTSQGRKCKIETNIAKNGVIKTIKTEIIYEENEVKLEDFGYNSDLHHSIIIKTEEESENIRKAQEEQHQVDKQSHSTKELPEQVNSTQPSTNNIVDKSYKCGICSYATSNKSHFQRHLKIHTGLLST